MEENQQKKSYSSLLSNLLQTFAEKSYTPQTCEPGSLEYDAISHCSRLLNQDYFVSELANMNGDLCSSYPSRILIPDCEKKGRVSQNGCSASVASHGSTATTQQQQTIYEERRDYSYLRNIIVSAKFARCRKRFPVPVIFYRDKHICRSATVSMQMERLGRQAVEYVLQSSDNKEQVKEAANGNGKPAENGTSSSDSPSDDVPEDDDPLISLSSWDVFNNDSPYQMDIDLLKAMSVGPIVDLMVEKKKVKYWMYVSTSEKADEEQRYHEFEIICIPYPGCEFFRAYRDNNFSGENLMFDWSQDFINAECQVPDNPSNQSLQINWNEYKTWDLVQITQNYLKLILKYIQDCEKSILIHCISGWDRTPLFISLVRLSLWADGLIHVSLTPAEITYYTVAYDWYLFGHQLPDRRNRLEEIMFFCFNFLKFIEDDKFQVVNVPQPRTRTKTVSSSESFVLAEDELQDDFDDENLSPNTSISRPESTNSNFNENRSPEDISTAKSPQKRTTTSPVAVPGASGRTRQRNDSTSSSEWTNVTDTGSIDTTGLSIKTTRNFMERINTRNIVGTRKERLNDVRTFFVRVYSKVVGLDFQEGTNSSIGTLLGNIMERVGDTFR